MFGSGHVSEKGVAHKGFTVKTSPTLIKTSPVGSQIIPKNVPTIEQCIGHIVTSSPYIKHHLHPVAPV